MTIPVKMRHFTVGSLATVGDNRVDSVGGEGLLSEKPNGIVCHGDCIESVNSYMGGTTNEGLSVKALDGLGVDSHSSRVSFYLPRD